MDIFGPLMTIGSDNRHILVFCDMLTRYSEIVEIQNKKETTIVKYLIERYVMNHSCSMTLMSDNAADFFFFF